VAWIENGVLIKNEVIDIKNRNKAVRVTVVDVKVAQSLAEL